MRRRALLALPAVFGSSAFAAGADGASGAPPAERARIERLLQAVAAEPRLRFERNGTQVGGSDAARFLRAKWQQRAAAVRDAEGFIVQVATRSSTTGRAYRVCEPDGRCVEAAAWLQQRLAEGDRASAAAAVRGS